MYIFTDFYLFLFFLIIMITGTVDTFFKSTKKSSLDSLSFIAVIVIYICIIVFRNGYGIDEPTYLNSYELYFNTNNINYLSYDVLFLFWYQILKFFGVYVEYFNNITCFTFLLLSILLSFQYDRNNKATFLMFFLFSYVTIDLFFNAYRQAFALIFFIFSIIYYLKGRKIYFGIFALLSIGFHWSVIIPYLFLIIAIYFPTSKCKCILKLIFIYTVIVLFFKPGVIEFISNLFNNIPYDFELKTKISAYLQASSGTTLYDLNINGRAPIIISVLVFVWYLIYYSHRINTVLISFISYYLIFCLFVIEMSYSFRNFYWILPLISVCVLIVYQNAKVKDYFISIVIFSIQLLMFFSSGIFPLIYK